MGTSCLSVRPHAFIFETTQRISKTSGIRGLHLKFSSEFNFVSYWSNVTSTLAYMTLKSKALVLSETAHRTKEREHDKIQATIKSTNAI
jgi:hypothetical protein